MKKIAANQLLAGVGLADRTPVCAVVTDSRKIVPGCVFVCFPGARVDGHDFAAAALAQGAAYILGNHPVEGVPADKMILCESSHRAMVRMAANYRMLFDPRMIGVTGSVGKTTTKEFCYAVLSAFGETLKTEGNQNNEIGLPNTLFRLEDTTRYAVVEMGMSNLGEIERLSRAARPTAGIITCIGVSHMESLGSRENILKAKLEICQGLAFGAPLALNADDDLLPAATLPERVRPVWFGIDHEADVRATDIRAQGDGQTFTLCDKEHGSFAVHIPTMGRHTVYDALAAYTAATRMGLDAAQCAAALADYQLTGMRQRVVHHHGVTVVEDCYNASPDSMAAALSMFEALPGAHHVALLGDMLELGGISKQAHRQVGEWVAEHKVDTLIAFGQESAEMAEAAKALGVETTHCIQPEQAVQCLRRCLQPGDALLAKASRSMALENILTAWYGEAKGE